LSQRRVATAALETYLDWSCPQRNGIFKISLIFGQVSCRVLLTAADGYIQCKSFPFTVIGQTSIPIDIAFDCKAAGLIVKKTPAIDVAVVKP